MSNPRIILPATGGGAFLIGLFYRRLFWVISGLLLAIILVAIIRELRGRRTLRL